MPPFTAHLAEGSAGECRIKFAGEFDFSGRDLADEMFERSGSAPTVVLDLSDLEFIDSMGIHFIVTAHERAQSEGRVLTIVRGGPQVERVFSLIGLDDVLPFADGADPA